MIPSQKNKYLETAVQTATPTQLLIMLYDGAIRFCRLSLEAIKQNRLDEASRNLCRAQEIIREFAITLDTSVPVSEQLVTLYDYFIFRLIEANTKKSAEPVEEVIGYLTELKETWVQAAKLAQAPVSASHG